MTDILEINDIRQEAKFLQEKDFNLDLLEILIGDRKGTPEQRKKLADIRSKLGKKIYTEIIYLLTHEVFESSTEAEGLYKVIMKHKSLLMYKLGRGVSIQVAALDYLQNVRDCLKKPTVIEEEKTLALAKKTISDELTQTYDANLLKSDLEVEIERSKRYNLPLSVAFADIDDFKDINDTYGHQTGDRVLQSVTYLLKNNIRKTDAVYRYGGDELVLMFPGIISAQASKTAGHIRKLLKENKVDSVKPSPTMSMGIASFDQEQTDNPESLLNAADVALYQAKRLGKDRICVYEDVKSKYAAIL